MDRAFWASPPACHGKNAWVDGGIGNTKRLIENLSDKERVGTAEAAVRYLNKHWREDVRNRRRDGPSTKRSKYEALDCDYSQRPLLRYKKLDIENIRSTSPHPRGRCPLPFALLATFVAVLEHPDFDLGRARRKLPYSSRLRKSKPSVSKSVTDASQAQRGASEVLRALRSRGIDLSADL